MQLASHSDARHADRLLVVIGATSGICVAWSRLAASTDGAGATWLMVLLQAAVAAQGGAALLWLVRAGLRWGVARRWRSHAVLRAYEAHDTVTYAVFLLSLATAIGVQLATPVALTLLALFALAQGTVLRRALPAGPLSGAGRQVTALSVLFFVSGMAALVYQVAWQRTLFRYFGVNMEPVTIIVSIFMLGLGLGALAGGRLSRLSPGRLPALFVAIELGIGAFGAVSLPLIHRVGEAAMTSSLLTVAAAVYALLAVPTFLMGATLPVLVAWLHHSYHDVGRSVARLYFVNTLGSAAACFLTVDVLFAFTGLRGATWFAAACNLTVAVLAFWIVQRRAPAPAAGVAHG
ncbi:MAG: spermidine synthase family protein [Gemmatimonadaceae bacterium]